MLKVAIQIITACTEVIGVHKHLKGVKKHFISFPSCIKLKGGQKVDKHYQSSIEHFCNPEKTCSCSPLVFSWINSYYMHSILSYLPKITALQALTTLPVLCPVQLHSGSFMVFLFPSWLENQNPFRLPCSQAPHAPETAECSAGLSIPRNRELLLWSRRTKAPVIACEHADIPSISSP